MHQKPLLFLSMIENVIFNVQINPYFIVKVKNGFKSFRAASAARELKHAA